MDNSLVILPTIRNPEFIEAYINNAKEHSFDLSKLELMVLTEGFVDKSNYQKNCLTWSIHSNARLQHGGNARQEKRTTTKNSLTTIDSIKE